MAENPPIRLCEWSSTPAREMPPAVRREIALAVDSWKEVNSLSDAPLAFEDAEGTTLSATHYVGVVEVQGCAIEIYPKLDRKILDSNRIDSALTAASVMSNLLWMIEVAGYMDLEEADTAQLNHAEVSYYDLFAFLLAKNLLAELERGVVHSYQAVRDDIPAIRGRIDLIRQCTQNWGRMDLHHCRWDEFTPDTPMNRLYKCACRHLQPRVRNPEPARLLACCAALLDEVPDVDPPTALRDARLRWDRSNDRFRRSFDMARRLLTGSAYEMASGADDVFVYLLDMNYVFESFVSSVVSARFGVPAFDQRPVGHLLHDGNRNLIKQVPDLQWTAADRKWIGDAKYKRLRGIANLEGEEFSGDAGRLGAADVRQLTCYAGLATEKSGPPHLAVFHPSVGDSNPDVVAYRTWNDADLYLVPVRVDKQQSAEEAIPAGAWMGSSGAKAMETRSG